MFHRILVPLDGSTHAERALQVAARLTRASRGTLVLLRVVDIATLYGPTFAAPVMPAATLNEDAQELAQSYLQQLAASPHLQEIATECLVSEGAPAATILNTVEAQHIDLVMMCSHGRGGLTRWALGSVAEHVAHHAAVPVCILNAHGAVPAGPHPDPAALLRVLVPLDGSQLAEAAIAPAVSLLTALSAPAPAALHLTLVAAPYEADPNNMPDALFLDGAKAYLAHMAERIHAETPTVTVTWSIAIDFDIAAGLLRVAENGEDAEGAGVFGGCDLIAMTTHGHAGMARWVLGSVTERVLHATTLPVLIVRPPEIATQEHLSTTVTHDSARDEDLHLQP